MLFKMPEILNGAMDFESFYVLLRKEKDPFVLKILFFIYDLYYGLTVLEASEKHKITKETGYKYAKKWRTTGIKNLKPVYNNGVSSKISNEEIDTVKKEIREGKIHNVDDIINFILKSYKIKYSKSWAYEFFHELSLEDGIKYPLPEKKENKIVKNDKKENNKTKIIINDNNLECLKVSNRLYLICYEEINLLNDFIENEKNDRLLKRYLFINCLKNGLNMHEAMKILSISSSTARRWIKKWNSSGLDGLIINWGDGRPCSLNEEDELKIKDYINNNHVTRYSEIHKFILDNFGIDYSLSHLYKIVKKTRF
jgi:transposase